MRRGRRGPGFAEPPLCERWGVSGAGCSSAPPPACRQLRAVGSTPLEGRQAGGALHPIAARVPVLGQGQPQPGSPCSPVRLPLACGQSVNFQLLFVGFWSHFGICWHRSAAVCSGVCWSPGSGCDEPVGEQCVLGVAAVLGGGAGRDLSLVLLGAIQI